MTTYVLGINSYLHDSSAALVRDGRMVFATAEERLSRVKEDVSFPVRSICAAPDLIRTVEYPNSLGSFLEAFTDVLGFQRHNDEWKVMGLAAYGEPTYDLDDAMQVTGDGYKKATRWTRRWCAAGPSTTWHRCSGAFAQHGVRRP